MDCSSLCFKLFTSILFLSNIVFAVSGVFLFGIGLAIKNYFTTYEAFLDDKFFSASTLLIVTGAIIFVVSFLGCCGACKQNRFMILGYSTLLTLLLVLEFASGVTAYVLSSQTTELLNDKVNQSMYKYTTTYDIAFLWDTVQHQFECCGLNNYTDWKNVFHNDSLPVSCCAFDTGAIDSITCNSSSKELYHDSCGQKVAADVKEHTMVLGGFAFGILGVQFLGILGSCYLSRLIKTMNYETV